jgi:hypothetical protein
MTQLQLYRLFFESAGFSRFVQGANNYGPWRDFDSEQSKRIYYKTFSPPQIEPDLHYFIYQYKLTDIMNAFVGLVDGIFVSQKCLEIFQKRLQLPPHKIYPVYYKKKSKIVSDYYYIYFYFGLRDSIIFDKSYFMIGDQFHVGKKKFEKEMIDINVQFKDLEHFESERRKHDDNNLGIDYQKIVFEKDSISKYDIFPVYLGIESDFYLSQKFIDLFESEKLTGLDARPFDAFGEED